MDFNRNLIAVFFISMIAMGVFYLGENINQRKFNFIYVVDFEETNGKKFEAWIPLPLSNSVQKISNLNINTNLKFKKSSSSYRKLELFAS